METKNNKNLDKNLEYLFSYVESHCTNNVQKPVNIEGTPHYVLRLKPDSRKGTDFYGAAIAIAKTIGPVTEDEKNHLIAIPILREPEKLELKLLHSSEIEEGGPQPRFEIKPDDPETVSLFYSIKEKGQCVPINVYPSPVSLGKYRILKGHRRRMVIFNMLQSDGIWAIVKHQSEQEAYENAFILHYERHNLLTYEFGAFLLRLQTQFPDAYPNQTVLGKKLGLSQSRVSQLISHFEEIERLRQDENNITTVIMQKIPERRTRELKKAPEELKTALYEQVAEKNLSVAKTKTLVTDVLADPNADAAVAKENAEALFAEADKIQQKNDKLLNKLIANAHVKAPEALVKELYGLTKEPRKVSVEKMNSTLEMVFLVLYSHAKNGNVMLEIFEEATKL
jgi:ParB/RepB/Spo0J family partition protein